MDREWSDRIDIKVLASNVTLEYAAEELRKYLLRMGSGHDSSDESVADSNDRVEIALGLFPDIGVHLGFTFEPEWDDAICIDIKNSRGFIGGSNPRSVLFGVYRFLEGNGCRWIRPGADGDFVPISDVFRLECHLCDKAHSRFRGINNCGANSLEHVLDKIEWAPKLGLNIFFNEMLLPKMLFDLWYGHEYPSLIEAEYRSVAELQSYNRQVIESIKKRGLFYHTGGHGWAAELFGISVAESNDRPYVFEFTDMDRIAGRIKQEERHFLAEVDGRRAVDRQGLRFTELCYGNPEVRRRLARCAADVIESSPEIDVLHFWMLSDAWNNHCECDSCRGIRPSEFYIMVLNGIDEELTQRGLATRICFLIYLEFMWAPVIEKIRNPDRFVMMFAPSSRNYEAPYPLDVAESDLPPFSYNDNPEYLPMEAYMASLRDWKRIFRGPSFAFDYHMVWHFHFDLGGYGFTKTMSEDIRRLPAIGLEGMVNCQIVRSSFPTAFPTYLNARLLWNPEEQTRRIASDYFDSAFGPDALSSIDYLLRLSTLSHPDYFYRSSMESDEATRIVVQDLLSLPATVDRYRPTIEKGTCRVNALQAESWKYLSIHSDLVVLLSHALRAKAEGSQKIADAYWDRVVEYVMANERRILDGFDPYWFFASFESMYFFRNKERMFTRYRTLDSNQRAHRRT